MTSDPSLLVILLNYRTAEMTLKAAEAALVDLEDLTGELLIIDNDSQDGSLAVLQNAVERRGWAASGKVRVIASPENGGFGAGCNIGIRAGLADGSAPDFVYLLNSDAFIDPGALKRLVTFLEDHPQIGLAGSQLRGDDDVPHTTHFRFPSVLGELEQAAKFGPLSRLLRRWVVPMPPTRTPVRADWTAGASLLIRNAVLEEIGHFDETYFLYFEETDLCLRAQRAGWDTWFVPGSTVIHVGSVSTGMKSWARMPSYWFASRRHYFRKNHGTLPAIGADIARITGAVIWRARCTLTRRPLGEPAFFLTDFLRDTLRAVFAKPRPAPGQPRILRDSK